MNNKPDTRNTENPGKVYNDELINKGTSLTDTPAETEARDAAEMEKVASGQTQKIDGGNPYADEDSTSDEEIRRETLEKK